VVYELTSTCSQDAELVSYSFGFGPFDVCVSCFRSGWFFTTACGFSSWGPVIWSLGLSSGLSSDGSDGSENADGGGGFFVEDGIEDVGTEE
jgi:hypothetical protein